MSTQIDPRTIMGDMARAIELEGYVRGLREAASRLEMMAAVVPSSVTKDWLLQEAGRQAATLRAMEGKATTEAETILGGALKELGGRSEDENG